MKRQIINSLNSAALIMLRVLIFSLLLVYTSPYSPAQTAETKISDEPVQLGKDIAELGTDGWLTVKNYQRVDKLETFSVDVSDALLSISKDSVSSSSNDVESIVGIKEAIVIFLKNGGVVAVRRNGRGTNCSGFKTEGLMTAYSLQKTSNADLWNIVVNGKSEYAVRVGSRPMDQVLVRTPGT